ncbi:MAG TPA: PepSY-like domain-containing protein [Polyangiaceae bacterium]|jgi:methionine-rich copper-binding protein CopC
MRFLLPVLASLALCTVAACSHEPSTNTSPAAESPAAACPAAVTASIAKELPGATITGCKPEHEDGREQYEVKVDKSGGDKVEVDVAPDGAILQTEQGIPLDQIPARVMTAFNAKYPGAKPTRAEKQMRTGKGAFYEIKFPAEPKAKEATFAEDGTFVEEE